MTAASRRDAANRWCARHPLISGMTGGAVFTLLMLTFVWPVTVGQTVFMFVVFTSIFTLTALSERRRRKKFNLPR